MDFISRFPKVKYMSSVMVVVDRFTKYAVFVPTPVTCLTEKTAELFLRHVVKHVGVLEDIMSDRDACFTRRLWMALFGLLGMELKFLSANHPQTDGRRRGSMRCWSS